MAHYRIRKGLDLPLAGAPAQQSIEPVRALRQVALLGAVTPGLRPALAVRPGERVRRGQLLCAARKTPGLRFTAPAAGTVRAMHRRATCPSRNKQPADRQRHPAVMQRGDRR